MASYDCLIDYIGLKGCSTTTPLSGKFINSLPGIDLRLFDSIADSQQATSDGVYTDIQIIAAQRIRNDTIAEFNRRYQIKNIQRSLDLGRIIDTTSTTATGTNYQGFTAQLNLENQSFVDSNLQQFYINSIAVFLSTAVNTTIKIFDTEQNIEIASQSVTGSAGWNVVNFVTFYNPRRIFVAYDATLVTGVELDITKFPQKGHNSSGISSSSCFGFDGICNSFLKIKGATATIADPFTITEGNNTFGLTGIFGVTCTFERLICNNLRTFENAWMYLLGSVTMDFLLNSPRLNETTAFDRANKFEELQLQFEAQYVGGEITKGDNTRTYPGELNQAIDSLRLDEADDCIRCNEPIRFMTGLP